MLIYICQALPIQSLVFFSNTLTQSNLKYKLIPQLESLDLVERKLYGYNKYGQKDIMLKGKALYDSLVLTRLGTSYVLGTLGTSQQVKVLHDYYAGINFHIDINMEERFKRIIMTDIFFKRDSFIAALLSCDFLKDNTRKILQLEYGDIENKIPDKYYFRALDCKRFNFDLQTLSETSPEIDKRTGPCWK